MVVLAEMRSDPKPKGALLSYLLKIGSLDLRFG